MYLMFSPVVSLYFAILLHCIVLFIYYYHPFFFWFSLFDDCFSVLYYCVILFISSPLAIAGGGIVA
jgi:hypothetical protein